MKLILNRRYLGPEYTIGSLFIDNEYICDTIEDRVRKGPKVPGETAIPEGDYKVSLTMSPKFKRLLPLIENVPGFKGIRIHRGNTAKDSAGCILPGENKEKGKVLRSTRYEMEIIQQILAAKLNHETIEIQIRNAK